MKKIILSIITTLSFLSCIDFINHDERGTLNLDTYFKTTEECQSFIDDLYKRAFLHYDWDKLIAPRLVNETATDDAWMGNTFQDASAFEPAAQYVITPNRMGYLTSLYKTRYENISACNIAINTIPSSPINEAYKDQFIGEALFMRAYNYYDLVNNFGDVPLILTILSSNEMNKVKDSKEKVYLQIENDLKSALAKVKSSYQESEKGRVTKWACTALLARVCLFQNKWKDAYHYADTTINHSGHALEPKFVDIWSVNNPNGVESILEAQTNDASDKQLGNQLSTFAGARGEKKENFPSKSAHDVMDGWGWCTPTSDLENCYISENDEIRRRCTITRNGEAAYGDEVLNPTHIFDLTQNKSGRIIRKYYIPVTTRRILIDKRMNAPLNVPIIRLAEMYLTRAEAAYHLNNNNQALDDIDFIRARVSLPPKKGTISGTQILYAIWKERRMELAFEGLRLFDIRRQIDPNTNKPVIAGLFGSSGSFVLYNTTSSKDQYETANKRELQDKGTNFDLNKHILWPIPQSEIDRSSGLIKQNPNY